MACQALRCARLKELQVAERHVEASMWKASPPRATSTLRVMQYNVLADAMSDDGFLVRPVLADWPVPERAVPTAEGGQVDFTALLAEMMEAKGKPSLLEECQRKYTCSASAENTRAVIDWEARKLQMMCLIENFDPDVVVLAELDHYDQFLGLLRSLGYESQLEKCKKDYPQYRPALLDSFSDKEPASSKSFAEAWAARGYAFLPHLGSISLHTFMQRGLGMKILEAAGPEWKERLTDPKKGGLQRNWSQVLPPGKAQQLLESAGLEDPRSLDDMGVAIFWKASRLEALELTLQPYPGGGKGIVQVKLQDKQETAAFVVMGTHLSSGDTLQDEDERLKREVNCEGGLVHALQRAQDLGDAVILCLDANSHPAIRAGGESSWKVLRQALGASVWDAFFDPQGAVVPAERPELDPPVTSNKVRGPLSAQAKKIGAHAYYLIDHIFYNPGFFEFRSHAFEPKRFKSSKDALEDVQPCLLNPSDHYPDPNTLSVKLKHAASGKKGYNRSQLKLCFAFVVMGSSTRALRLGSTLRAFWPISQPRAGQSSHYDVVVVGAGSAGAHLAYRLSTNPSCRVLLIEAGRQDNALWVHVPVFYFKAIGTPDFDWMWKTDGPTTGLGGRSLAWPRGKVLGGSSSLNGLLYVRGLQSDYDAWAVQNPGWSYEELLPHFQSSEDAPPELSDLGEAAPDTPTFRGSGGPMSVTGNSYRTELSERWSQACAEVCQVPRVRDMSDVAGDQQGGAGVAYFSNFKTPGGFRCSSALPLHEVRHQRSNLHIYCKTQVERLVLHGQRVTGVVVNGQEVSAGEVVLSAGALGSPHLLLQNGIGSPAKLEEAGVKCVHDLPGVGENLQDHLQLRPKFRVRGTPTLNSEVGALVKYAVQGGYLGWLKAMSSPTAWRCGWEFLWNRSGPVSMAASQVCAFVPSRICDVTATTRSKPPDLQFHFQPLSTRALEGTAAVHLDDFDAFTASVCILRPESRGRVALRRDGSLCISPHYLSTDHDQRLALRSLELAREVAQHPLLREIGAEEVDPPAETNLDHARRVAETIYHPAGTCKMGPSSDEEAVVDNELRVHGLEGLRIVDCSIMPTITSGNTHVPTVMIAEKAARLIGT
ncbi:Oxygen-dependent choline dehydrogenase (CDH) (CHD) (Betaine aldehyde dehydrogenase) (BADH) [Durusdinium trenchii]|uniref:Oxygen-dependent choline dehydrogenase (CDH) (CHD) (Betaine aldehyde dehydrogenase) (BADH) n=1 Tax=Durusdinium trenchii TaxID=1381693 RepID=A0ABP0I284_9DINO